MEQDCSFPELGWGWGEGEAVATTEAEQILSMQATALKSPGRKYPGCSVPTTGQEGTYTGPGLASQVPVRGLELGGAVGGPGPSGSSGDGGGSRPASL